MMKQATVYFRGTNSFRLMSCYFNVFSFISNQDMRVRHTQKPAAAVFHLLLCMQILRRL